MMRTILAFCLVSVVSLAAISARAEVPPDFYKTDVPVASQSTADRSAAFQQAMAQILVKITGSTVIMQMPKAGELAQQAAKYVRQFRYAEQALPPGQMKPANSSEDYKPFIISVTFNGEALERALLEAGLPVWNADRPPVLVLAGVQDRNQRLILSAEMEHPVKQALEQAAALRGVPLLFPLMDQKERSKLDFADIRGGFSESLLQVAKRYGVSLVLEGYIETDSAGDWSARWAVHRDNVSSRWNDSYVALEEAVQSGIGGVADVLASRYAIATTADNTLLDVLVQVGRLNSLGDYAAVLNYLSGLIFIESAIPVRIESGSVVFRVLMRSELAELDRILSVSRILQPVTPTATDVGTGAHIDLMYNYQKR
ncbi:MAG TPA: DUF2066 domain-containing protein [Gammaproteobacteria bacterium]|nr:DUF2066 domain-containing protein [Gammaproteobacteria bacterium]